MNRKMLATILLIPFLIYTLYAVYEVGVVGIFTHQIANPGGIQVFVDLVIALVLVLTWLVSDAKKHNRKAMPWVVLTLCTGSIGPLLYLATEKRTAS